MAGLDPAIHVAVEQPADHHRRADDSDDDRTDAREPVEE
jgi:hypothetical protein